VIDDTLVLVLVSIAIIFIVLLGLLAMIAKFYRKVDQGRALIINKLGTEPIVTFTGGTVVPVIHRAEVMDISVKTIELERRAHEGLICKDNIRADIKVTFFVRVNKTVEDVLKVAQSIGCARASDQQTLEELFVAKFSEALKTVGKRLDFEQLYTQREQFKDDIVDVIGRDLNGYSLEDAAIDFLEQTPLDHLDENNILDSQGIRKITEMTVTQNLLTNELRRKEEMERGSQDLGAREALFRFEQQEKEAEAKKNKEINIAQTREENEALRMRHEEQKRTMLAKQKADEEVAKGEQNKMREVEAAQKDRERVIAVESVRVQKARDLEDISREREVELQRIAKEKALEVERKEIADVIRGRIAVEKTVAEEEERIKDLRVLAESKRNKDSRIIDAEGQAQEELVKQIKAAEAQEEVTKFQARQRKISAEADLEAADLTAKAKMRTAEGVQAEVAAEGLAQVKVKEANAVALEKEGAAQARVTRQKMEAEAAGEEQKGLAVIRVKQAEVEVSQKEGLVRAEVIEKEGLAKAIVTEKDGDVRASILQKERLAEVAGIRERGMAEAAVQTAKADALERQGQAEGNAIREKLVAEAAGLAEKATAMKALDGVGREHEEFRLRLEHKREIEVQRINANREIAQAQATILAKAFDQASINIVGGDGAFFERFMQAVTLGQSIDGFVNNSQSARSMLSDYLEGGEGSFTQDLREILSRPSLDADAVQSLTLSALLGRLMVNADEPGQAKLRNLIAKARELGIDSLAVKSTPSSDDT